MDVGRTYYNPETGEIYDRLPADLLVENDQIVAAVKSNVYDLAGMQAAHRCDCDMPECRPIFSRLLVSIRNSDDPPSREQIAQEFAIAVEMLAEMLEKLPTPDPRFVAAKQKWVGILTHGN